MFLTVLEHEGQRWKVDLNVIPAKREAGMLEFSFTGSSGEEEVRLSWRVSGESLEALSEDGIDVSEDLLRRQLEVALAEARTVDAGGLR